ncbi:putative ribosomal protein L9/RNase H1 [Helianthus annuus]|nr:putative ribosomal protein L9/RNase H1 [Helianthus annuus]
MSVRFLSYGITNFTTNRSAVKTINNYGFPLMTRFGTRCSLKTAAKTKKSDSKMDDGFFVVRKGDLVGVYNNLIDCQAQVGSSVCDPPVSVYKGYTMSKECEAYLESCGLKNALYSIRAVDLRHELFGTLVPCPFQVLYT